MKLGAVATVFKKELLDVLRDRRTLFFMLVIPTLAMPLIMWGMTSLTTHFAKKLASEKQNVLVLNPELAPSLFERIKKNANPMDKAERLMALLKAKGLNEQDLSMVSGQDPSAFGRLLEKKGVDPAALERDIKQVVNIDDFDPSPSNILSYAFPPNLNLVLELEPGAAMAQDEKLLQEQLTEAIRTDKIAAVVRFSEGSEERLVRGDATEVGILFLESSDRSTTAKSGLQRILKDIGTSIVSERINDRALPSGFANPVKIKPVPLPGASFLAKLMSQILPYLIIIFAFLGAMYPAIDLGAGEKERGTLETLLVVPVSRITLVLGKFLVVTLAALVSAVLGTVSMAVSFQIQLSQTLSMVSGSTLSFGWSATLVAILLALPICCISAAMLLCISMFAKSYKEAQSLASPLQLIIIFPAFASLLPGIKLDWATSSIPITNVALALKEIFTGNIDQHGGHIVWIFATTCVFAGLLLWFAAWWTRRESVLFRS